MRPFFVCSLFLAACAWAIVLPAHAQQASSEDTSPTASENGLKPALRTPAPQNSAPRTPVPLADRVVAWVDEDAVTLTELQEALAHYQSQGDIAPGKADEARLREARERWIDEALILAQARQRHIEVPTESLDNRVEGILARMEKSQGGAEAFNRFLARGGTDRRALRAQLREWTRREWILAQAVNERIAITDEEVKRFVEERTQKGQPTLRYHLSHLFFPIGKEAPEERWKDAEERGRGVLAAVSPGRAFSEVAGTFAERSRDEGVQGGFLGILEPRELQPELAAALENMEIGKPSGPIRTGRGVHFLLIERKTTPREILYTIRFEEERAKWIKELRRKATIQEDRL